MPNIKVAHFTTQLQGGAGIATQRLHFALCRHGVGSRLYFGTGQSVDETTIPAFRNASLFWGSVARVANSWRSRRTAPGGFVTSPGWIRRTPIQKFGPVPRVINLHWVARWLDLPTFFDSLPANFPVVWSLHDLIPVTGGCNHPAECDNFTRECGNCPQLIKPKPHDETYKFFHVKDRNYANLNLHFVGNSEWTTTQIRRSGLAKHARTIRTIPLGLDVKQYRPIDKAIAKKALGIPEGRFVVGFACVDLSDLRKGADLLQEALNEFGYDNISLITCGSGAWPDSARVETLHLGVLRSTRLQCLFYSALDVFVISSRAETFGNTAIEAMACETPVVAYAAGGLKDVVVSGETGLLEPEIGSVSGLTGMFQWMAQHPIERQTMGVAARQRVLTRFTDTLMAQRYSHMYEQLLSPV